MKKHCKTTTKNKNQSQAIYLLSLHKNFYEQRNNVKSLYHFSVSKFQTSNQNKINNNPFRIKKHDLFLQAQQKNISRKNYFRGNLDQET